MKNQFAHRTACDLTRENGLVAVRIPLVHMTVFIAWRVQWPVPGAEGAWARCLRARLVRAKAGNPHFSPHFLAGSLLHSRHQHRRLLRQLQAHLQPQQPPLPHPQPPACVRLYVSPAPCCRLTAARVDPAFSGSTKHSGTTANRSCDEQVHLQTGQCVSLPRGRSSRRDLTSDRVTKLVPPSGRPSLASTASTAPVSTMAPRTSSSSA